MSRQCPLLRSLRRKVDRVVRVQVCRLRSELNPATSAAAVKSTTPERLAVGVGATQYSPPLEDPRGPCSRLQLCLARRHPGHSCTIQYLNERKQFEVAFLEALSKSNVPVTLMWGVRDIVSRFELQTTFG
jgi:hypothetical protein